MDAQVPSSAEPEGDIRHFLGPPDGIGIPDPNTVPRGFQLTRDWRYFPRIPPTQWTQAAAVQEKWCTVIDKYFRLLQLIVADRHAEPDADNRRHGVVES